MANNFLNTSDEYHTANEDSFTGANAQLNNNNNSMNSVNNINAVTAAATPPATLAARKQLTPLPGGNVDPNEPSKPLSAYALFFRDTVSAIKQQNPNCSFQELSKIVAAMWETLDQQNKNVYIKRNELAKVEYLTQMRIYKQQLEQQQQQQQQQEHVQQSTAFNSNANPQQMLLQNNQNSIQNQTNANNVFVNSSAPQQQQHVQVLANQQQIVQNSAATTANAAPAGDQNQLLSEPGIVQKCTREDCNKRAIINPDWEDEYCSNECVIIHCRTVFNEWVQANLEAKRNATQLQQQQTIS